MNPRTIVPSSLVFSKLKTILIAFLVLGATFDAIASIDTQIDDREPNILIWPETTNRGIGHFQFYFERSGVKEQIRSAATNQNVEAYEQSTYSANLIFDIERHHFGVQFGPTRIPLLNLSLNLNYQFDFYSSDDFKLGIAGMYGGILYPGLRFGALIMASYRFDKKYVFLSAQTIRSNRYFKRGNYVDTSYESDNAVSYVLESNIFSVGVRFPINAVNCYMEVSGGYEHGNILRETAVYSPSNYNRSDGILLAVSLIF